MKHIRRRQHTTKVAWLALPFAIALTGAAVGGVAYADQPTALPPKAQAIAAQAAHGPAGAPAGVPGKAAAAAAAAPAAAVVATVDCGSYCSTSDGSPSLNGNGTGTSTSKPCAGCVGKADNKNPPGQASDGTDRNKGYECDGNHGIGRSNPAHSGCTPPPPPPPPPTPVTDCLGVVGGTATAADCIPPLTGGGGGGSVLTPDVLTLGGGTLTALPRTGANTQTTALAGLLLLLTGGAMLVTSRRVHA